jgi:hypothetical protein
MDDGVASGGVPSDMTADELAWYLQTGNLPARYSIRAPRSKRGKGKLTITHGDEMNGGQRMSLEDLFNPETPRKGAPNLPPVRRTPVRGGPAIGIPKGRRVSGDLDGLFMEGRGSKRSDRAEIVRQVMRERGVSLPQASSIVKNEGLY